MLQTDASDVGGGAVLAQVVDGKERPISFCKLVMGTGRTELQRDGQRVVGGSKGASEVETVLVGAINIDPDGQ